MILLVRRCNRYSFVVIIVLILVLCVPPPVAAFTIPRRTARTTTVNNIIQSQQQQWRRRQQQGREIPAGQTLTIDMKSIKEEDENDSSIISKNGINNLNLNLNQFLDDLNINRSFVENFDRIRSNVMDGTVGERGEIYVLIQAVLFVGLFLGYLPFVQDTIEVVFGPVVFFSGVSVIVGSVLSLGPDRLSPWPVPPLSTVSASTNNSDDDADGDADADTDDDGLVTTGWLYGQVRHPLYTGVLLSGVGLSIITNSASRFLFTLFLWYLFDIKSEYEETALKKVFGPVAYGSYMDDVPNKFIPKSVLNIMYSSTKSK